MGDRGDRKVLDELVHYFLAVNGKQGKIKEKDLAAFWKKNHVSSINQKREIIEDAKNLMSKLFGFLLVDQDKREYYLQNKFSQTLEIDDNDQEGEAEQNCKRGLVFLILSFILMRQPQEGAAVSERELKNFLKNFGVEFGKGLRHKAFGELDKLLICSSARAQGEFVQHGWLSIRTVEGLEGGDPEFEVRWGPRAREVVSKEGVLDFVSKLYGCEPEEWGRAYANNV